MKNISHIEYLKPQAPYLTKVVGWWAEDCFYNKMRDEHWRLNPIFLYQVWVKHYPSKLRWKIVVMFNYCSSDKGGSQINFSTTYITNRLLESQNSLRPKAFITGENGSASMRFATSSFLFFICPAFFLTEYSRSFCEQIQWNYNNPPLKKISLTLDSRYAPASYRTH